MKEDTKYTDTSKCPTQKALEQYVFSEINNAEQYAIERHLLHCKICDDVVEGLMLLKDEKELIFAAQNINKKIDAAVGTNKNNNRTFLAIAAGLALLIGLTFYFSKNTQEQLAASIDTKENASEMLKQDSVSDVTVEDNADSKEITIKPSKNEQLASDFKAEKNVMAPKTPLIESLRNDLASEAMLDNTETSNQNYAPVAANEDKPIVVREDLTNTKALKDDAKAEENFAVIAAISDKKTTDVNPKIREAAEGKAMAESETKAKPQAESLSKKVAIEKQNEVSDVNKFTATNTASPQVSEKSAELKEIQVQEYKSRKLDSFMADRANANSNYKSGSNYFEKKNFEKAIKCFDTVLKYPKTDFYEDAQFLKAKCLIELGKKEEAKTLLQIIVNQNGKHKQEAQKILVDSR